MADTSENRQLKRVGGVSALTLTAIVIAALILLPIAAVVWLAMSPSDNIWAHLLSTTLPRYFTTTLILMFSVGFGALILGVGTAWCVVMYRFPLSRLFEWALLLPLALPAYVSAYALVDFFEYAGPLQGMLRSYFGWKSSQDYWFFDVRSLGMAIVVLSGALYPYVYLLTRAAFREQNAASYEAARCLGSGPWRRFFGLGLPLARPAIAAGVAIVMMETAADFGTVEYFGVQTLTTGIFTTWLERSNVAGAAQISCVLLALVFLLYGFEKVSRASNRYHNSARHNRPHQKLTLRGVKGLLATLFCAFPFVLGFVLPFSVILHHALSSQSWVDPGLIKAVWNTVFVGGSAGLITVGLALIMVYGIRLTGRRLPRLILPFTALGYAAPGAVLAVGTLVPLAAFDHIIADAILAATGWDPGLILTGTSLALIFAFTVRFFAIAQSAADSAFGRLSPGLSMAARSLGRAPLGVLRDVELPLIRGSVAVALLLVFVDCVKELPATLLLRPFNFNTLSTRVYEQASLENLKDAAPASLLIALVGLVAVAVLARMSQDSRVAE